MDEVKSPARPSEKLRCRKCGTPFQYHLQKGWILKMINLIYPVGVYFCVSCMTKRFMAVKR